MLTFPVSDSSCFKQTNRPQGGGGMTHDPDPWESSLLCHSSAVECAAL
jgi:hypothetical protein